MTTVKKTVYTLGFTDEELDAMQTTCRILYNIFNTMPLNGVIFNMNTGSGQREDTVRGAYELLTELADRHHPNWFTLDDSEDSEDSEDEFPF